MIFDEWGNARRSLLIPTVVAVAFLFVAMAPLASDESFGFGFVSDSASTTNDAQGSGGDDEADAGFGFGAISDAASSAIASTGAKISGEALVGTSLFADDVDNLSSLRNATPGKNFAGKLNFSAAGSNADAAINLKVDANDSSDSPVSVDEAYVRAYWGKLDFETGLRKLSWGKADSSSVLDVVNPLDFSDLTVTDALDRKLARPMAHVSYSLGFFTKIEGVFVPGFQGNTLALDGKWAPAQLMELRDELTTAAGSAVSKVTATSGLSAEDSAALASALSTSVASSLDSFDPMSLYPETDTLKYSQAGLRFTTTIGSSDIGLQYYFGYLPTPAIAIDSANLFKVTTPADPTMALNPDAISVAYNPYHQIGVDWAAVVATLNARAELAANITSDLSGDDGGVYNPSVLWSLGFDRDLLAGINLNAQGAGSVRLMNDKIADDVSDCEANTDMTHTTITVKLSRKFLKEEFELSCAGLWGIEDRDFLAMPELAWRKGDTEVIFALGIFGGNHDGNLGQYDDNDYAKLSLSYSF